MADWLYRVGGGAHAWTGDGKNFWLVGGGWWAWRDGDWLYPAKGGSPLGWFDDGGWFYENGTGKALYFFS